MFWIIASVIALAVVGLLVWIIRGFREEDEIGSIDFTFRGIAALNRR